VVQRGTPAISRGFPTLISFIQTYLSRRRKSLRSPRSAADRHEKESSLLHRPSRFKSRAAVVPFGGPADNLSRSSGDLTLDRTFSASGFLRPRSAKLLYSAQTYGPGNHQLPRRSRLAFEFRRAHLLRSRGTAQRGMDRLLNNFFFSIPFFPLLFPLLFFCFLCEDFSPRVLAAVSSTGLASPFGLLTNSARMGRSNVR